MFYWYINYSSTGTISTRLQDVENALTSRVKLDRSTFSGSRNPLQHFDMFVLDEVSSLQPRENVGGIATIARCVLLRYWGNSRIHCTCYSTFFGGLGTTFAALPSTVAAAEAVSSMDTMTTCHASFCLQ